MFKLYNGKKCLALRLRVSIDERTRIKDSITSAYIQGNVEIYKDLGVEFRYFQLACSTYSMYIPGGIGLHGYGEGSLIVFACPSVRPGKRPKGQKL